MEKWWNVRLMNTRIFYIIGSALVAGFYAFYWGALLQKSDAAVGNITAVISILAGVLVAVISIVGDPSMLLKGNWRVGKEHAKEIQNRLSRFSHLFFVYVLTLIGLVVATVMRDAKTSYVELAFQCVSFLVVFSLLLSLPLSYSLMRIQRDRMNKEVNDRKGSGS